MSEVAVAGPVPVRASPDVTVIICCYTERRRWQIVAAVESVHAQTVPAREVVVVVDHNPELLEWLTGRITGVRLIPNAHDTGLTGARNCGVEASRGEVVAFLDDDATAGPEWLATLLAEYVDPGVVAVGGRIDPVWEAPRPPWFPPEFGWVVGCSYRGQPTGRAAVRNVIGANMSFRREVVRQVGGFRRELGRVGSVPVGCEETELCIRAAARTGGRVIHQPAAVVEHRVPSDRGEWAYFRERCVAEGRSKAVVSRLAGSGAALSAERAYVRRTLPAGVLRGLRAGLAGEPGGFGRAAAILAGLALTTAGYVAGHAHRTVGRPSAPGPGPSGTSSVGVWCAEIELSGSGEVTAVLPHTAAHVTARVLVRLHGEPLGHLTLPARHGPPGRGEIRQVAWRTMYERIAEHLRSEGAPVPGPQRPEDLPPPAPGCPNRPETGEPVSVVVCTRGRSDVLAACLAGLRRLTYPDLEILVVDNAPVDRTTHDVVRRFRAVDDRFHYVLEPRPGLSHARNAGAAHACGTFVAYTDDDVVVDPRWVEGLVRAFGRRPDVACVTGLVCSAGIDGPVEAYFDARASSWWNRCRPALFDMRSSRPDHPLYPYTPAMFGTGANMAFERRFLRDTGGFDVALGAGTRTGGGEDVDKFVETLLCGRAIAYEPAALVWHRHRSDHAALLRQMFGYGSGLTAVVAKHLTRRATAGRVLVRVPRGVRAALARRADTEQRLDAAAPAGAARREMLGLLAGPFLYAMARRDRRRPTA